jgi:tetratricopeptide (TPR) repeat protein
MFVERLAIVFFVSLALFVAAPAARAAVESPEVLAGIAAYNALEYDKAIDHLHRAVKESLTREEKMAAYRTLGFCHVALGKQELAIDDFETVLRMDDSFELDRTRSPRERAAFEEAKARVATGQAKIREGSLQLAALKPEVAPVQPRAGQTVHIRVAYPGGMAEQLGVFYRTRGLGLYSKLLVPADKTGHFDATLPGARVQAPGLEYYLVALDENLASVAKAGSLARPLSVNVTEVHVPVYKRGWFWAMLAGVAVAGAGAATAVVLTRPTQSSVTIMPY